ncbi:adenylate/guanylate cyclase domain-containing protein [Calothrix sp. NIES-3974]|uniref:adenylate/guanylate cyclase domain-containing protein n=1 Tax=Calothrix sp. NIES-3974 TaxID=2005462 RepID=UPI000B608C57|nr:adenylate/guanylate cyclase domain-containing protein [Calothrix sp. NIES-3974]BAZ05427.1 adenylate/guanylate cyclase [Calothrix sp. NIES-3974]
MTELTLRIQQGNTENTVEVKQDIFMIGRLPECDLCLPFGGVSRYHARLLKTPNEEWLLEDLGSKNGTVLNDRLVTKPQILQDGDILWLGNACLEAILRKKAPEISGSLSANLEQRTILRNVQQLKQRWLQPENPGEQNNDKNKDKTIARLKDLVDIAKNLSAATSIEEIFHQVQQVVFRYLQSIDRLALLIDLNGKGTPELVNAAARTRSQNHHLSADDTWISHSICEKVFEEKVAIQIADAQKDERFATEHSIVANDIRSAMAVPLWDESKVVGVLYADAHLSSYHWDEAGEEELSFFSALANIVASSVQRWLLAEKLKSEEIIRQRLERYHSPAVVQQLIEVGALGDGRLTPTESEISILFADIVGFTAISERLTPTQIAEMLNKLFEEMLQEIFAYGGTLDKYIGDCIMAFFGAPEPQSDHPERAVAAAQGMLNRLAQLNADHFWQEPLQLRIAINSGKAVVGDVGSSQRFEYTALGTTINLASRLESICPPGECVVSEVTYKMLKNPADFSEMGLYRFKGINRLVKVYQTRINSFESL